MIYAHRSAGRLFAQSDAGTGRQGGSLRRVMPEQREEAYFAQSDARYKEREEHSAQSDAG